MNKLKEILEKINEEKEELKMKILQIFTKIRNELNKREDELMDEVQKLYDEIYFKEELIQDNKKLQEDIKLTIEKGKKIISEIKNIKLNELIHNYINFEKITNKINYINDAIINKEKNKIIISFNINEENINSTLEKIKKFGCLEIFYLFKSSILKDNIAKKISILNWIKEKTHTKDIIKSELVFKMSENGESWEDFHKYCDNKGPTLVLIKTTKDKIFGGFTPLNWKKEENTYIKDISNQTFIFSLNLNKKFDMKNFEQKALRYKTKFGPIFGDKDIALNENMKSGISFTNKNCNFLSNNNLELTGGNGESETFENEEVEVFKINFSY